MFGSDIESFVTPLFGLSLSFDYTERQYQNYTHPPDYFGRPMTGATRGGNGYIWRIGLGLKTHLSPIDGIRMFGIVGIATSVQNYENVYYVSTIDDYGDIEYSAPNPSSAFTASYFRGGLDVLVASSIGINVTVSAFENEFRGYFLQASSGVFITW